MFNYNLRLLIWSCLLLFTPQTMAYNSTYDLIQWEPRGEDKEYCIDITDHEFNIYPGFQTIACGKDMYEFSPRKYVEEVLKTSVSNGFTFYWRVWSPNGYGGNGFEGKVTVGADCGLPYRSDSEKVQWGCRFQDTNYCIDIFDKDWKDIKRAFVCGENMHSFDPQRLNELNLPSGKYHWKVWSAHAYNYEVYQKYFEGSFEYNAPVATPTEPVTTTIEQDAKFMKSDFNSSITWEITNLTDNSRPFEIIFESNGAITEVRNSSDGGFSDTDTWQIDAQGNLSTVFSFYGSIISVITHKPKSKAGNCYITDSTMTNSGWHKQYKMCKK